MGSIKKSLVVFLRKGSVDEDDVDPLEDLFLGADLGTWGTN